MDLQGDSRVDPQTTLTMLWRNSWPKTGHPWRPRGSSLGKNLPFFLARLDLNLTFFRPNFFLARLDFSPPQLTAPGFPRMITGQAHEKLTSICFYDNKLSNRPRSIYSSMAPRLSGQNCKLFKFPLSLNSQKRLGCKRNNTKYRSLTWKPRSHVRILIYRT